MKPRARNLLACVLVSAWMLTPLPPIERAAGAPAAEPASPTPAGKGEAKKKRRGEGNATAPASSPAKGGGSIPLPLVVGKPGVNVKIPDMDSTGKLLSLLLAQKATRLDEDRVKLEEMDMDFNKPDGKQDFHISMPASILNLKTHIITSEDPVTVKTQDFELTGEKMEFNTVEREGRLIGNVRMVIYNLKGLTGQKQTGEQTK